MDGESKNKNLFVIGKIIILLLISVGLCITMINKKSKDEEPKKES